MGKSLFQEKTPEDKRKKQESLAKEAGISVK